MPRLEVGARGRVVPQRRVSEPADAVQGREQRLRLGGRGAVERVVLPLRSRRPGRRPERDTRGGLVELDQLLRQSELGEAALWPGRTCPAPRPSVRGRSAPARARAGPARRARCRRRPGPPASQRRATARRPRSGAAGSAGRRGCTRHSPRWSCHRHGGTAPRPGRAVPQTRSRRRPGALRSPGCSGSAPASAGRRAPGTARARAGRSSPPRRPRRACRRRGACCRRTRVPRGRRTPTPRPRRSRSIAATRRTCPGGTCRSRSGSPGASGSRLPSPRSPRATPCAPATAGGRR